MGVESNMYASQIDKMVDYTKDTSDLVLIFMTWAPLSSEVEIW